MASLSAQQVHDQVLDLEDVLGKPRNPTRLRDNVTIRGENATAALRVEAHNEFRLFAVQHHPSATTFPTRSACTRINFARAAE
jgi:hypothetical protein